MQQKRKEAEVLDFTTLCVVIQSEYCSRGSTRLTALSALTWSLRPVAALALNTRKPASKYVAERFMLELKNVFVVRLFDQFKVFL
jgi:hypothetical protein